MPPTMMVGRSSAWFQIWPIIEVVVVLPCVPATAMEYLSRISSPSISARRMTGIPRSTPASRSGLSFGTAEE